jgi:hypothetical protein
MWGVPRATITGIGEEQVVLKIVKYYLPKFFLRFTKTLQLKLIETNFLFSG